MSISAGDKIAKVKGMRFVKSPAKGTPGIEVAFEFFENDMPERMTWVGWLSERAVERTMTTLVDVLGYNGSEVTDTHGVYTDPSVVDFKREVKLVVEAEAYVNAQGEARTSMKIKWVNSLGGGQFASVDPQTVKAELASTGFRAAFLAAKKNGGGQDSPQPKPLDKNEPLPF